MEEREFLRVRQVALALSISPASVYRLLDSGQLPSRRFGGARRILRSDLEAYLKRTKEESRR